MRRMRATVLAVVLLAACSDLTIDPAVDTILTPIAAPSWSLHIAPVLRETCGSSGACHGGPTPQRGLLLEGSATVMYNQLVGVPSSVRPAFQLVKPGAPDSSFFLMVMSETTSVRLAYRRMPMTQQPMPLPIRLTIRNWIQAGALNN